MVQPESGPAKAVCTAFPSGSITAATSIEMLGGTRQALTAGTVTNSANPPFTSTPRMRVFSHTWAFPVRQAMQWLSTMWLSHATRSPISTSVTVAPRSTTSPTNSCPRVTGGLSRSSDQRSQV